MGGHNALTGRQGLARTVSIIGAGMVGVACALELQRRGMEVRLIDRNLPGRETSYGNAGVMARSSLVPFNNPTLFAALPRLLLNRSAQFRYDPAYLLNNMHWGVRFLANARQSVFARSRVALDALIQLSIGEHRRLMQEAGSLARLRDTGWLFLYRSDDAYAHGKAIRAVYALHGVATEALDSVGIVELEPHIAPLFRRALWVKDASSVDNPGAVVDSYAALFAARGGTIERRDVQALESGPSGSWRIVDSSGLTTHADQVVVALGPWAREFLVKLKLRVPMAYERGYHRQYAGDTDRRISRPIYDTGGGYVLSPMDAGLRLTTGVEFARRAAPQKSAQLDMAERLARQAFALGEQLDSPTWLGARPTLPDSLPMIGPSSRLPGLWLAFGHQHIGFTTGAGTAAIIGALIAGELPPIDARPFAPARFRC
jgi:D-amino-acid dehydrogenase